MIIRPRLQALNLSELLDASFRLFRNNFLTFVKITALVLVPYNLLAFVLANPAEPIQSNGSIPNFFSSFLSVTSSPGSSGWLGFLYSLIIQPLLYATLVLTAAQRYQQQPAAIGNNLKAARGRLISLLGANILQGLIVVLAALPVLAVAMCAAQVWVGPVLDSALSGGSSAASDPLPTILALVVGGVFLVLPLVVSARLILCAQAVVLEERRAAESIDRSWKLTEGRIWRVVGFVIVVGLLEICLSTFPVGTVVFGASLLGIDEQLIAALRLALSTIAEIVMLPFGIIAYTLLFFDLRIRREGFDLEQHDLFAPPLNDVEYQPWLSA